MGMRAPRIVLLAVFCSLSLSACGGGKGGPDGGAVGPGPEELAIRDFNAALLAYVEAAGASHAAAMAAVEASTLDLRCSFDPAQGGGLEFCVSDLAMTESPDDPAAFILDWWGDSVAQLAPAVLAQRRALARAHALFLAAQPVLLGQSSSGLSSGDSKWGSQQQPLLFVTIGALVGAVLLNKALNETMESAVATRTEPVKKKIREGTEETLTAIKEEMGLDAAATREEVLATFEAKPVAELLDTGKDLELALTERSISEAGVEAPDWQEINNSIAQAAQACGETAVKQVAGWWATGAGGQGVSQVADMLGVGQAASAMVDMTLSVVGAQPLDLLAMIVGKEVTPVQVAAPAPADPPSVSEALAVLEDPSAASATVNAAAEAVSRDIAIEPEAAATTQPDGSLVADVPTSVFVNKIAQPTGTNLMPVPDMGPATALFGAAGYVPELQGDVTIDDAILDPAPLVWEPQPIGEFLAGLGGGSDGGTADGGGGGTPTGELYVNLPLAPIMTGTDALLEVHCGVDTTFPATLDVTGGSTAGVSIAWGSGLMACPISVIFNADTAATYELGFSLTGSAGERQVGQASVLVHESAPVCDGSLHDQCVLSNSLDAEKDACMQGCTASVDQATETRLWQICWFQCEIPWREVGCECGRETGCILTSSAVSDWCCMRQCQVENLACLRSIPEDNPPDDMGSCNGELATCVNDGCAR